MRGTPETGMEEKAGDAAKTQLLDEPQASLDIAARYTFAERVRHLAARGHAIILVTYKSGYRPRYYFKETGELPAAQSRVLRYWAYRESKYKSRNFSGESGVHTRARAAAPVMTRALPAHPGDCVEIAARIARTGRTSVTVCGEIFINEDPAPPGVAPESPRPDQETVGGPAR